MPRTDTRRSFFTKGALAGAAAFQPLAAFGQAIQGANTASSPSDLRITDVRCAYVGGSLYVKIHTNQGIWGCGEAVDAIGGTYYMVQNMGRQLRNQSPLNVNPLAERIRVGGVFGGAQSGIFIAVLTALETALWDLAGKALNVPVYQLLGGKFRDRIRVYCDTAFYSARDTGPAAFAKGIKGAMEAGYTAVKFDLDEAGDPNKYDRTNWTASPGEVERMVAQLTAAREAAGPKMDICADMHGRYDLPTGLRVAKRLEPLNLLWLEEPIPAENVDAYKKIADETSTPICAGENIYLAQGFRRGMEIGAWDIVMPDLQKTGGLGEGLRIANMAHLHYIPFAPHMVASFLGAMATSHVCAAVPNFLIMEWQTYFDTQPRWKEMVHYDGPQVTKGFITVSNKPGIGVDINEEGMRRYASQNLPFFEADTSGGRGGRGVPGVGPGGAPGGPGGRGGQTPAAPGGTPAAPGGRAGQTPAAPAGTPAAPAAAPAGRGRGGQ
jgi:galactonate dehydratase